MSDEAEWLRSGKTWDLLHSAKVGYPNVEHHLRAALLMGKVHARAAMATIELRGRDGGRRTLTDWDVPPEVWEGTSENSRFDLRSDTYGTGDYAVRIGAVQLKGMSFHKAEMLAWFGIEARPEPLTEAPQPQSKGRGGRKPKSPEWNNALAAVIVYAQCKGGVEQDQQPGAFLSAALDFASELGLEGNAISIERCADGIRLAQRLVGKSEGWPNWEAS